MLSWHVLWNLGLQKNFKNEYFFYCFFLFSSVLPHRSDSSCCPWPLKQHLLRSLLPHTKACTLLQSTEIYTECLPLGCAPGSFYLVVASTTIIAILHPRYLCSFKFHLFSICTPSSWYFVLNLRNLKLRVIPSLKHWLTFLNPNRLASTLWTFSSTWQVISTKYFVARIFFSYT